MAHFVKPRKPNAADKFTDKGDGSLSSMTISGKSGKHFVVVWGGDAKGNELSLEAWSAKGKRLATIIPAGREGGHRPDPDNDHKWFVLYEIVPKIEGTGTLTAMDAKRMPFARITLTITADQSIKVELQQPESVIFVEQTFKVVEPASLTPFTVPPVPHNLQLRPDTAVATVAELLFRIEKSGSVFWVGACVPEGTSDFTRAYIYFHPDTMADSEGTYRSFTGRWRGVRDNYLPLLGTQLGSIRKMVLLLPFMTASSGSNQAGTNMFADRGDELLNEIMTACQEASGGGSKDVRLRRVGLSSYSSGINHVARFTDKMAGKVQVEEQIDFDSGWMKIAHRNAAVIKGAKNFMLSQNPPATKHNNTWYYLYPDAWELIDGPPGPAKVGKKVFGENIHAKIGHFMFKAMMARSNVK